MPHVDDTIDTLLEEVLQNTTAERLSIPATAASSPGRLGRFFGTLAASMSLQRGRSLTPGARRSSLSPADILAQEYPHLYLRAMCG
jgi:hypothetical protein